MSWKTNLLILLILLGACRGEEKTPAIPEKTVAEPSAYAHPESLIEAPELLAVRGNEHIRIIDFREREAFDQGHLPGAIPMWRSDIEDPLHHVPGMVATRAEMEKLFSSLGISPLDTLILYDDQGGVNAARLWWVLRTYGFDQVRLLNGGLQSWQDHNGAVSADYKTLPERPFRFPSGDTPHLKIEKDSLQSLLKADHWTLIDARTPEEYSGQRMKKGAKNAGRIPGSLNIDWADAVYYNGSKKFRTVDELKRIYKDLPDSTDTPVVVYCHSGVRSAHTSFVLTQLLGYNRVYNYDGSWLEWSASEGAPIEKDSTTLILQ